MQDVFTLKNGVTMPRIGFGTYNTSDDEACRVVCDAVEVGYRLIDTAAIYENEAGIGRALATCGVPREELFITSKVWNTHRGYDKTMESFNASCERLGVDYLDLFLVHWPANEKQFGAEAETINADTWRALEDLYKNGDVRAIGLSNFKPHHIEALLKHAEIEPMVDQIEFYPGRIQTETLEYCLERDLVVEAWSPLGRGKRSDRRDRRALWKIERAGVLAVAHPARHASPSEVGQHRAHETEPRSLRLRTHA